MLSPRLLPRRIAGLLLLALQVACSDVDLDGARVRCTSDGDCPDGQTCITAIELCATDPNPPKPGIVADSVVLDDDVYAPGRSVLLSFSTDLDLAFDPEVVFNTSGRAPFTLQSHEGRSYTFVGHVTGAEGVGAVAIVARLVSSAGGVSDDTAVASIAIDATPPSVTALAIDGPRSLRTGSTGIVALTASEAIASASVQLVDGDRVVGALQDTGEGTPPVFRYRYTAVGGEPEQSEVEVVLVDEAGNASPPVRFPAFSFDVVAPTLTLTSPTPQAVRAGRTLELVLDSSEPLGAMTARLVRGSEVLALEAVVLEAGGAVLRRVITAQDPEGTWGLEVTSFTDAPGNAGVAFATVNDAVEIDQTPPALLSTTTSPPPPPDGSVLRLPEGAALGLEFVIVEPAATPPVVRIDGVALSADVCDDVDGTGVAFSCLLTATADLGEGIHQISADVFDAAGHFAVLSLGTFFADFTAPALVSSNALRVPGIQRADPALTASCAADALLLSRTDPQNGEPVTAVLTLIADEAIDDGSDAVALLIDTPTGGTVEVAPTRVQLGIVDFFVDTALLVDEGCHPLRVRWRDRQGTGATVEVTGRALYLDETPPTVSIDPAALVYRRAPQGTRLGPQPTFVVEGAAGAITRAGGGDLGVIVARDGSGDPRADVGDARVAADGSFSATVRGGDPGVVFVIGVSPSGVRSAPVVARTVEYTAAMNGKVPNSTFANPNRLDERRVFLDGAPLFPESGAAELGGAEAAVVDGQVRATSTGASYRLLPRGGGVVADLQGVAWDAVRGTLVATHATGTAESRAGAFVEATVVDREGDGEPTTDARGLDVRAALAFDARQGAVLAASGGTFHFTGTSWKRVQGLQREPETLSMPLTSAPELGLVVGFGGCFDSIPCFAPGLEAATTWVWDGTSWTELVPELEGVTAPGRRSVGGLSWDPLRERVVLSGGFFNFPSAPCASFGATNGTNSCVYRDTWEFDPTTSTWERIDISSFVPPMAQVNWATVFDPDLGGVLGIGSGRTFLYDGQWRELTLAAGNDPPQNVDAQPVHDPITRRVYTQDNADFLTPDDTLYAFDGRRWTRVRTIADASPAPLLGQTMVFDDVRSAVVMMGGKTNVATNTLFTHDGFRFRAATPATTPPARFFHNMAWDTRRHVGVLFGGFSGSALLGDTWEWNGTTWTQRCLAGVCGATPPARAEFGMAFDEARGVSVVFGGAGAADTWLYDGARWTQCLTSGSPCVLTVGPDGLPPPNRSALAFDRRRGVVVLLGRSNTSGFETETWEWNGATWARRQRAARGDPVGPPTSPSYPVIAWDDSRGAVVLTTMSADGSVMETWLWQGEAGRWRQLEHVDAEGDGNPPVRFDHAMSSDPENGVMVTEGAGSAQVSDAWVLAPDVRAAHVMLAPFGAAAAPADAVVQDISTSWLAGGEGSLAGARVTGTLLFAWRADHFEPVAVGAGSVGAPREMRFSARAAGFTPAQLSAFFVGEDQKVGFAVASTGVDGVDPARVATDGVDVTIRYLLP